MKYKHLQQNGELAAAAADGLWSNPLCLALFCVSTSVLRHHPIAVSGIILSMGLLLAARLLMVRHVGPDDTELGNFWRRWMIRSQVASGMVWAILVTWIGIEYGTTSYTGAIAMLCHGAAALFAIRMLSADLDYSLQYTLLLFFSPAALTAAFSHRSSISGALAFLAYGAFVYVRAWRLNAAFVTRMQAKTRDAAMETDSGDCAWVWDVASGAVQYTNRWKQMVGLEPEVNLSLLDDWFSRVHPDDEVGLEKALVEYVAHGTGTFEREHRLRHDDGTWRWLQARGTATRDAQGTAIQVTGTHSDVTAGKLTDPLTGLANRLAVMERIEQMVSRTDSSARQFFVMFLDLDRFKLINDSLGHLAGDQVLLGVSSRLTETLAGKLGSKGCVSRLGGDEFVVLVDNPSPENAERIACDLLSAMEQPVVVGSHQELQSPIFVRTSIGIAHGLPGDKPEDLLRNADTAMYHAKSAGRGRFRIFDQTMHDRAVSRLELETDLRQAIDRNQFELYFQPQVELRTGMLSGFEALVRWRHPERGLVMPAEFITVVEENGLIVPLGQWVLQTACLQLARWREFFPGADRLTISVNISSKQFSDPLLAPTVARVLEEANLPPSLLHVEITESILVDDPQSARAVLSELKRMGVSLEIDDFGTGYSSLSQLHQLPFDTLKVDRSFVQDIGREGDGRKIVQSISSLARSLGINVVAEGIETEDQWLLLEALGCQLGQGYYFSRPVEADESAELIAQRLHSPWPWPDGALSRSINDLLALGPALDEGKGSAGPGQSQRTSEVRK